MVWIPRASADPKVVSVKAGVSVPFDGVLYSTEAHALLVSKMKAAAGKAKLECDLQLGRLRLSLDSQLRQKQIELDGEKKTHALASKLLESQKTLLLGELKKASKTPWYRSPTFVYIVGVVSTVGLTALAIWGAGKLR